MNFESHIRGIRVGSLPKTIQDAISITQHLGLHFLWVDALCIVQDSVNGEDWYRESSRMSDVYSNAYVTILAESGRNSDAGMLNKRPETDRSFKTPFYLADGSQCGSVYLQWENTWLGRHRPLQYRAWAFQERRLSRRVLSYCQSQIIFTCKSGTVDEVSMNFRSDSRRGADPYPFSREHFKTKEKVFLEWYRSVNAYSLRDLTYKSDKLPALSGYAHAMHELIGGAYLAGIWEQDLLVGLTWYVFTKGRHFVKRCQKRAPSWSWASLDGAIIHDLPWMKNCYRQQESSLRLKIIEANVAPTSSDCMGQVADGFLKVSGHIKRAAWVPLKKDFRTSTNLEDFHSNDSQLKDWDILADIVGDERSNIDGNARSSVATNNTGRPLANCFFDTEDTQPKIIWCLAVIHGRGLMLEYLAEKDVYRRVGIFAFSDPAWMSNCPVSTITIV